MDVAPGSVSGLDGGSLGEVQSTLVGCQPNIFVCLFYITFFVNIQSKKGSFFSFSLFFISTIICVEFLNYCITILLYQKIKR